MRVLPLKIPYFGDCRNCSGHRALIPESDLGFSDHKQETHVRINYCSIINHLNMKTLFVPALPFSSFLQNVLQRLIRLLPFMMLLLRLSSAQAQDAPSISWLKCHGGTAYENSPVFDKTGDGGFIMAGWSISSDGEVEGSHGKYDCWVTRLDAQGDLVWQKALGGHQIDEAYSIRHTTDGGYIMAASSESEDGDVTDSHGDDDYWIVKLDSAGNISWQKTYGGEEDDYAQCIQQTTDGGYAIAGYSASDNDDVTENNGSFDYWIVKIDSAGNIEWQKSYGGSRNDQAECVLQTVDGGYLVGGFTTSDDDDVESNHGARDYWIMKLDTSGNMIWNKTYGGSGADGCNFIQATADGNYLALGWTYSFDGDVLYNHGGSDCWLLKLDPEGNMLWQKSLGGSNNDWTGSSFQTDDGGFVLTASASSSDGDLTDNNGLLDCWTAKIDSIGNVQWQKSIGGADNDHGQFVLPADDGSIIMAGHTRSQDGDITGNHGNYDYLLVKLTCSDTFYRDLDGDAYGDMSNFSLGCFAPAGYVADHADCDDGNPAIHPAADEICNNLDDNCNGVTDDGLVFTAYYADADGDSFGDPYESQLACTPVSNYVTDHTDCDDSNPEINPAAAEISGNGADDDCDGYVDEVAVGINSPANGEQQMAVYPNPTRGTSTLYMQLTKAVTAHSEIEISNLIGQVIEVYQSQVNNGRLEEVIRFDKSVANGFYVIKVRIADQQFMAKVRLQR